MTSGETEAVAPLHAVVTKRKKTRCGHCRERMIRLTGELHDSDGVAGIFIASLYKHEGVHEVFVDAILGAPDDGSDRVTITTRTGPSGPGGQIASTLVDGAASYRDDPMFGHKISREEGLASPRLTEFWAASDAILSQVREIDMHLYRP